MENILLKKSFQDIYGNIYALYEYIIVWCSIQEICKYISKNTVNLELVRGAMDCWRDEKKKTGGCSCWNGKFGIRFDIYSQLYLWTSVQRRREVLNFTLSVILCSSHPDRFLHGSLGCERKTDVATCASSLWNGKKKREQAAKESGKRKRREKKEYEKKSRKTLPYLIH